jgi:hypothetical protein
VESGQLVAVPLNDGTFALGHVAHHYYRQATLAHFSHRADTPGKLLDGLEEATRDRLVAVLAVTDDEICGGQWPVIGHKEPSYPETLLDMKGSSYTANVSRGLLNAYYGLEPWDGMGDPRCHEKMLLPGIPVPPTVRYKRDFERDAAVAAAAAATPPDAPEPLISEGGGVIHIEITYPGDDLPTMPLLKRRQAIETGLEAAGVGEVTDAGGGGGVMDIFLETNDVARAMPFVHAAIKEAGFENDARIEVDPLSEDDDDDSAEDEGN